MNPVHLEPLGDAAYIWRDPPMPAYLLARALNRMHVPGLLEAASSYDTLGLFVEPKDFVPDHIGHTLEGILDGPEIETRFLKIPVNFDLGEDLELSAERLRLERSKLIEAFCSILFTCYAVGFCPGFPYLGYLPPELAKLTRMATPRVRVPKGSVAITDDQAGIYTMEKPGGWNILGRTPYELVSVEDEYYPIEAGDRIQFYPIDGDEYRRLEGKRL